MLFFSDSQFSLLYVHSFYIIFIEYFHFKVTLFSSDEMREYLTTQYGYSLDTIPVSLGGTFDPILTGNIRYQICLSKVTNSQSICYPYYSLDNQSLTRKSLNNILYYNTDYHNQEKSIVSSTTTAMASPSSLLALVSLRRHYESPSQLRIRKRESSSPADNDKRRRSNESLIEEEESSSSLLQKEIFDE